MKKCIYLVKIYMHTHVVPTYIIRKNEEIIKH